MDSRFEARVTGLGLALVFMTCFALAGITCRKLRVRNRLREPPTLHSNIRKREYSEESRIFRATRCLGFNRIMIDGPLVLFPPRVKARARPCEHGPCKPPRTKAVAATVASCMFVHQY